MYRSYFSYGLVTDIFYRSAQYCIKIKPSQNLARTAVFWLLFVLFPFLENRHFGETNMNDRSSRSHTIFRVVSYLVPVAPTGPQKKFQWKESRQRKGERSKLNGSWSEIGMRWDACLLAPRFPTALYPFALTFATYFKIVALLVSTTMIPYLSFCFLIVIH